MSGGPKPTKHEIIQMAILEKVGMPRTAIAKAIHRDKKTVRKYLGMELALEDKELVDKLANKILGQEINDLALLAAKARDHLHTLLDGGKMRPIEATALLDRSFQQRRILEGRSTSNIAVLGQILSDMSTKDIKDLKTEAAEIAKTQK